MWKRILGTSVTRAVLSRTGQARGRKDNRFPWGATEPSCDAVVFGRSPGQVCAHTGSGPRDVGTTAGDRTPQGIYDLGGNVSERVQDSISDRYPTCMNYKNPRASEPVVGGEVLRDFRAGNFLPGRGDRLLFHWGVCRVKPL